MDTIRIGSRQVEPYTVIEEAQKAAGLFRTIALFSVINAALNLFHAGFVFVIGLGASVVVDAVIGEVLKEAKPPLATIIVAVGLLVNLFLIGIFVLLWWLSKLGYRAAYVIGMVLYLLDGLIFLVAKDVVGIGFHLFFLYGLRGGYQYVKVRRQAEQMLAQQAKMPDAAPPIAQPVV